MLPRLTDDRTDRELLAAVARGERDAFGAFAHRHERDLLGLAKGLLHGDRDHAMDAVQDTWLRVLRSAGSFKGTSEARTWVTRILVNRCHDLRRKHARRLTFNGKVPTSPRHTDPDVPSDRVRLALERLSEPKRLVVLLCTCRGLTREQVSEILDIPPGTVKSRLHNALEELRGMLTDEPQEVESP